MRKVIVKEWITLDGVFDAANMDQWFFPYDSTERRAHITEVYAGCDAYLLGKTTYEMLWPYWSSQKNDDNGPASWLNSVRKYVVSSTLKKAEWNNTTIIRENVTEEIATLKRRPGKDILIDGSATLVHSLMDTALIDEYQFLIQPAIMGSGRRFFEEEKSITRLKLVNTKMLNHGVLALTFKVTKNNPTIA